MIAYLFQYSAVDEVVSLQIHVTIKWLYVLLIFQMEETLKGGL